MSGDPRCLVCRGDGTVRDGDGDIPCACVGSPRRDLYTTSEPERFDWGAFVAEARQRANDLEAHRALCTVAPCAKCERGRCRCGQPFEGLGTHDHCPACRAEERLRRAVARVSATVPPRFKWAITGELDTLCERVKLERERIQRALSSPPAGSMMLVGDTGSGKTSLTVAMLMAGVRMAPDLRDRDLFASSFMLAGARNRHPLGKGEAPEVIAAVSAPLLLLDDLGSEGEARASVLSEIIFARHEADLPTWITTGFPADQLMARYGSAIIRRLIEVRKPVELGK
jgi:DNA replication protein DnaC